MIQFLTGEKYFEYGFSMRNGLTNIQDFILNLAEYHRGGGEARLPFVLILGVATTAAVIHRALPHPVSKLLAIEKFSGQGRHCQNWI